MQLTIGSYNLGGGAQDPANFLGYKEDETKDEAFIRWGSHRRPGHEEAANRRWQEIERACAAKMAENPSDVYLFQEFATHEPRSITNVLLGEPFVLLGSERDCAIAINTNKFHSIEMVELEGEHTRAYTVVKAVEEATGKRFAFASIHATAVELPDLEVNIQQWKEEKARVYRQDSIVSPKRGDDECKSLAENLKKLKEDGLVDEIVVGGDFNISPELWYHRHSFLEQLGLKRRDPDKATNVYRNPNFPSTRVFRKMDYFHVSAQGGGVAVRVLRSVRNFFYTPSFFSYSPAQVVHPRGVGWDPEGNGNFSDHAMVEIKAFFHPAEWHKRNTLAVVCTLGLTILGGLVLLRRPEWLLGSARALIGS